MKTIENGKTKYAFWANSDDGYERKEFESYAEAKEYGEDFLFKTFCEGEEWVDPDDIRYGVDIVHKRPARLIDEKVVEVPVTEWEKALAEVNEEKTAGMKDAIMRMGNN